MKYAIIKTGGKQYKVKVGDKIKIEKIEANEDQTIELQEVLLIFDEDKGEINDLKIGQPAVSKALVKVKVIEQGRAKKVDVIKYKPKIRYKKKYGHRQPYTKIEVLEIVG